MITTKNYLTWTRVTLGLIFFLILVGGVVRSTGSGLGCPDWPKCFGQWVPPTHVSELPENYKEIYKVAGREIADFDAFKTWTEYINRLIGVFIGMAIIAMVVLSFSFKGKSLAVFWGSWAALGLVIFQGWIGAVVVASYLAGYMITIHMFLALCLVLLVLWLLRVAESVDGALKEHPQSSYARQLITALFWLSVLQLLLGTQLREGIDLVVKSSPDLPRENWVEETGLIFLVHRSFSLLLIALQVLYWKQLKSSGAGDSKGLNSLFVVTVLSGIGLAYFGLPAFLQPVHLLAALALVTWYFDLSYLKAAKGGLISLRAGS